MEINTKIDVAEVKGKLLLTRYPCEYFQTNDKHDFDCFLQKLRGNKHVNLVRFGSRFGFPCEKLYTAVLQAVSEILNLTELEFWSTRVPITRLCRVLPSAKNLVRLGLAQVTLDIAADDDDNNNFSGLAYHPNLQEFFLSDIRLLIRKENARKDGNNSDINNNNNNNAREEGAETGREQPDCEAILDSLWKVLATCPRLNHVEVFSNQFLKLPWTPKGLAHLATCASLDQLKLRRLNLTSANIAPFAKQMSTSNYQLRLLNLHGNKLKDEGCISVVRAIVRSDCAVTVRELDLRDNQVSAKGGQVLISVLTTAVTTSGRNNSLVLEKLNLASNPIGDECAILFAEMLERQDEENSPVRCRLKHLDLSKASMSDAGCTRLAQALRANSTLLSLNLGYNNMTNNTYLAFGDALRTDNRTLVSLNLQVSRQTKIEPSGCAALLQW